MHWRQWVSLVWKCLRSRWLLLQVDHSKKWSCSQKNNISNNNDDRTPRQKRAEWAVKWRTLPLRQVITGSSHNAPCKAKGLLPRKHLTILAHLSLGSCKEHVYDFLASQNGLQRAFNKCFTCAQSFSLSRLFWIKSGLLHISCWWKILTTWPGPPALFLFFVFVKWSIIE